MEAILFYLFAAMTLTGALGVVLSRQIVRAAVQLLIALLGVGALYFLLSAEFLAAVQLVIYVGGTLVLIIFGVMLTWRASLVLLRPTRIEVAFAVTAAALLVASIVTAILSTRFAVDPLAVEGDPVRALGHALLGPYVLPFELASVLLLAVMIGAAFLARKREPERAA